jgi:thioredoxin reductase (NADPH)
LAETPNHNAAKPIILAIDDDDEVLHSVARDLRARYAGAYRIIPVASGEAALETLREIEARSGSNAVALLLADQRMPGMSGVAFLEQARALAPQARRVLLTAYADTEAAIEAINAARIHHYLVKPWDPPQDKLYPVLDDLLEDWQSQYRPPFDGVRVYGLRWAPASHEIRDFLSRQQVPYQWLDVEEATRDKNPDQRTRRALAVLGSDADTLPVVIFTDGSRLCRPTSAEIAEKLGLRTKAAQPFYDLVIIGGGPAGLAGAVYGASEGLSTLLVEREAPGGQAGTSSRIENYLGFPAGVSGADLARRAQTQAVRFGVEILAPREAAGLRVDGPYRVVSLAECAPDGGATEVSCHALLIAIGVAWRQLSDVPGVERLTGAGVYYGAALTEAMSCSDEKVFVIGGANSAGQAAMYFARFASDVTMLVRAAELRKGMSDYLAAQIEATQNIHVRLQTRMIEVHGGERLERITIASDALGTSETIPASSVFIFIGAEPRTDWLEAVLARDEHGFLLTGPDLPRDPRRHERPNGWPLDRDPFLLESTVPGVFVAGDVRHGSIKRISSGVGEGAVAVSEIHRYLAGFR